VPVLSPSKIGTHGARIGEAGTGEEGSVIEFKKTRITSTVDSAHVEFTLWYRTNDVEFVSFKLTSNRTNDVDLSFFASIRNSLIQRGTWLGVRARR